tara:strand:- start:548 stop:1909 length:1362 start_codon:yes stop_codon:yes gene_type:complete
MNIFKSLAITIVAISSYNMSATHLMGGEIVSQQISGLQYKITLTTYRDTIGVAMAPSANFSVKDTSGSVIMTFSTTYDSIISGNTLPMYPYGVEVYFFIDTITLPYEGMFTIGWSNCCRNGAIQNITNPLNQSMFLQTEMTAMDSLSNSTPFFLVPAAIFLPINTPWQYNPLPFDPDGDSLNWSLSFPLNNWNTACPGFTIPPASSSGPMTINPVTGTITWTANTLGNFVATVLVEEYRNGFKIGSIRRDMQFITVTTSNIGPQWNTANLPVDALGNIHINLIQNSSFQLDLSGYSISGQPLYVEAYGEPFFTQPNPAAFTSVGSGVNDSISANILWAPSASQTRSTPYILAIRLSDGYLMQDLSLIFTVSTTVSAIDELCNSFKAYPNPAYDHISFDNQPAHAILISMDGHISSLERNGSIWDISTLKSGLYILQTLDGSGSVLETEKLLIK